MHPRNTLWLSSLSLALLVSCLPRTLGAPFTASSSMQQALGAFYLSPGGRQPLNDNTPLPIQTNAKGDNVATILADGEIRNIASDVVTSAATKVIMAAPGIAAIPIIGLAGTVLLKMPGIVRQPKVTMVYALAGRQSGTTITTTSPRFQLSFGDVVGVNPDEFEPALLKITPTNNNWRLAYALKTNPKFFQSAERIELNFIEERVPIRLNRIGRGHVEVEPQQSLGAGEYGLVLRPTSKTQKISLKDSVYKVGEGGLLSSLWDFAIIKN